MLNKITVDDIDGLELIEYNSDGAILWSNVLYFMQHRTNWPLCNIEPIGLYAIGFGGVKLTCFKTI